MEKYKQEEISKISDGWYKVSFENMADIVKDTYKPDQEKSLPYIGLEHINQQTLSLNSIGHSSEVGSNKFNFRQGDILFGKLRPYFRKVYRPNFEGVCSTDIWVVRAKEGIDQGYLYYFMASQEFVDLATSGSSGTKMPRADWNHLKDIEWFIPSLGCQHTIAKILSDLDEKIELNRQMNKALESIAQAIFKRWFVEFEFPGCVKAKFINGLPEGWRISNIGKELITVLGGTPSRTESKYWDKGTIPWINSGKANEFRVIEPSEFITQEGLDSSATKLMPEKTTIIAITGATLGQVSYLEISTCANQSIVGILPSNRFPGEFLYFWIKNNVDSLISWQTGGAQQHINKNNVNDFELLCPSEQVMQEYLAVVKPIFEQIKLNCLESKALISVRDSLLPKLMSGKTQVRQERE